MTNLQDIHGHREDVSINSDTALLRAGAYRFHGKLVNGGGSGGVKGYGVRGEILVTGVFGLSSN